jgi:hypothetical protein
VEIVFCHSCGMRVAEQDLQSGAAVTDQEHRAFCPKCAPAQRPARRTGGHPLTPGGTAARAVRTPTSGRFSGTPLAEARSPSTRGRAVQEPEITAPASALPWFLVIGGVVLVVVLGGVLFLVLGGGSEKPPPRRAAKAAPVEVPPPPVRKEAPPVTIAPPSPPPVPVKAEEPGTIDDIREGIARKTWADLKAEIDRRGQASWDLRAKARGFVSRYGSTAAGKEAAGFLAGLSKDDLPPPRDEQVFADSKREFHQETPAEGWRYLWNAKGPVGDPRNYQELVWNAKHWAYASKADTYPDTPPAHYARLGADQVHPGAAYGGAQGVEHYVISEYRVPERIHGPCALWFHARRTGPVGSNGKRTVDLRCYVNAEQKLQFTVDGNQGECELATPLGTLNGGDKVYVAIGPDGECAHDTTDFVFKLYALP